MDILLLFAKYYATTEHVVRRMHLHSGVPYTHHLQDVERVLRRFGETRIVLLAAAWLHDVVEDCAEVKIKHIIELFGAEVAALVAAVTKEKGPRSQVTLPNLEQIRTTMDAVILKLADRIANVESGGNMVEKYRQEHAAFTHGLSGAKTTNPEMVARMWAHLNGLLAVEPT